jgi:uncharacterized protein (TIGR02996 family)
MSDHAALLRAILVDPADDAPRLVLADWLDENGEPERAEFIRLDIAARRNPRSAASANVAARWKCSIYAIRHIRELTCSAWPADLRQTFQWDRMTRSGPAYGNIRIVGHFQLASGKEARFVLDRGGFVAEISLPVAAFLAHAEALFRVHPATTIHLKGRAPFAGSSASHSWYRDGSIPPGGPEIHLQSNLPGPLWDELSGYVQAAPGRAKWYESEAAARNALSRACVRHGRHLAGLPDIDE